MPTWLLAVLITGGLTAFTIAVFFLLRAGLVRSYAAGNIDNEVVAFLTGALATISGLLLAFYFFTVLTGYDNARTTVGHEVATIDSLYNEAAALPNPSRTQLRQLLRQYTAETINQEWKAMADGNESPDVTAVIHRLFALQNRVQLSRSPLGSDLRMLLAQLDGQRTARIDESGQTVSTSFLVALFFGVIVTLIAACTLVTGNTRLQAFLLGCFALFMGLMLSVIVAYDRPFAGSIAISPAPLQQELTAIRQSGR